MLVDPHSITQMSATYEAVTAARTFSALAQTVFQATGWPRFNVCGCNWLSPLTEGNCGLTIWIMMTVSNWVRVFRRPALKVSKQYNLRGTSGRLNILDVLFVSALISLNDTFSDCSPFSVVVDGVEGVADSVIRCK